MIRRLLIALTGAATWLAMGALPAAAAPPERVLTEIYDPSVTVVDEFLSEACGVEVRSTAKGHFRLTLHFDRAGEITRVVAHPSFSNVLSSDYGSLTTADRGMDRFTLNPDGTVTIFGTGIHLKVKGGAYAIGLWVLTIDESTGEQVSAEYHGRFDLLEPQILDYVCGELAPDLPA
ncbi:hypothetical protein ACI797_02890 [Geodermatophilus sp. SYSU D00691]